MVEPTDLKTINQALLSSYSRFNVYCGLTSEFDFSGFGSLDCDYYQDDYVFIFSNGHVVDDWSLSPSDLDKMLKICRQTQKKREKESRANRRKEKDEPAR